MVYLTPKGGNAGPDGGGGPYPVLVQYNSLKALNQSQRVSDLRASADGHHYGIHIRLVHRRI